MLWFFVPYSQDKKMFEAWDRLMNLVANPNDWVCMMDGDVMFLLSDFGHQIQEYIDRYPDTGLFTCYASRTGNKDQRLEEEMSENPDIVFHRIRAEYCRDHFKLRVKDIFKAYGHLLCIKKSTWTAIRPRVKELTRASNLFDTDTAVSAGVRKAGMKIRVMESVYVLHYYRLKDKNRNHLI